jgi:iron complex outermembrane recepter protein
MSKSVLCCSVYARPASMMLAGFIAVALWSVSDSVRADSATLAAASGAGSPALEEVIITARRRAERSSDVPLAVTVESGGELQQQSALLIEDVVREAPNVLAFKSARSVSALEVSMRGQTAIPSSIVYDPAVGLYIDGVYVANGQGAMGTLLDVDRVEIVRGAQGTLFGRNNTGGSIAIVTHRPDLGGYREEFSLSAGSKSLFEGRAIFNVPLSGSLGLRLSYQDNRRDGWGSSVATGQTNFMNQHRDQLRVGALWKPADSFDAYFTYERFTAIEVGALLHPLAGEFPGTIASQLPGNIFPADLYQTDTGKIQNDRATTDALQLTLNRQFSATLAARLILGYRELHASNDYDADAVAAPIADVLLSSTSFQKSAELQLNGQSATGAVDWVGGLYAFRDNGSADSTLAPVTPFLNPGPPAPTYELNAVQNKSVAAFLHSEWRVRPAWHVAAGLRYTDDSRSLADNAFIDLSTLGGPPQFCTIVTDPSSAIPLGALTGGACPSIDRSVSFQYWSWEVSSRYRFSDRLMAYLRSGRAQRSGGWNIPFNTLQDLPFRPEVLTDIELGLKAQSTDGRWSAEAAAFTGNYDEMQRLLARLIGNTPTTSVINAGKARVSGLELSGQLQLLRPWRVQASFGYTDASYRQFIDPFGNDASSNKFYMTPRSQWSLASSYEFPVPAGVLRVRADYAWRDRVEFNVIQDPAFPVNQGPLGLLNARISFASRDQSIEVALFARNLLDRSYGYIGGSILSPPPLPPVASWVAAGDRRSYGVEATYRLRAAR